MTTTETQHEACSTALVLCGGGAHGALEVGFVQALEELGIRYDHIFGSSIGALNGAFLAGGTAPAKLADLWRTARLWRFARPNWRWLTHPRTQPGLLSLSALRRFLETHLPVRRFEDLPIPLSIVTTDLLTGRACYWEDEGDILDPLLASMSVPGLFPPVMLDGRSHTDGGVADNAPLTRAADCGDRRALMIECACAAPCARPPAGLIGVIGRAFEIALARKYKAELILEAHRIETLRVVPHLISEPGFLDLSAAGSLIQTGYLQTMQDLPAQMECGNRAMIPEVQNGAGPHVPHRLQEVENR